MNVNEVTPDHLPVHQIVGQNSSSLTLLKDIQNGDLKRIKRMLELERDT